MTRQPRTHPYPRGRSARGFGFTVGALSREGARGGIGLHPRRGQKGAGGWGRGPPDRQSRHRPARNLARVLRRRSFGLLQDRSAGPKPHSRSEHLKRFRAALRASDRHHLARASLKRRSQGLAGRKRRTGGAIRPRGGTPQRPNIPDLRPRAVRVRAPGPETASAGSVRSGLLRPPPPARPLPDGRGRTLGRAVPHRTPPDAPLADGTGGE
jgi:hypothetical protein